MDEIEVAGEVDATATQWCAVYDTRTGAVVHLHEHIALERAGRRSEKDLAYDAMAEVSPQHDRGRLAVALPKRGVPLERAVRYRVGIDDRQIRAERRERPKPRPDS
jgi:hypothetical protein